MKMGKQNQSYSFKSEMMNPSKVISENEGREEGILKRKKNEMIISHEIHRSIDLIILLREFFT